MSDLLQLIRVPLLQLKTRGVRGRSKRARRFIKINQFSKGAKWRWRRWWRVNSRPEAKWCDYDEIRSWDVRYAFGDVVIKSRRKRVKLRNRRRRAARTGRRWSCSHWRIHGYHFSSIKKHNLEDWKSKRGVEQNDQISNNPSFIFIELQAKLSRKCSAGWTFPGHSSEAVAVDRLQKIREIAYGVIYFTR